MTYLSTGQLDTVRSLFADEVIRSCQLMMTHVDRNWTMNSVEVAPNNNDQGTVHRVFDRMSLCDEVHGQKYYRDLKHCIGKSGSAVVKAGMLMTDRSTRLKRKQVVSVFDSLLRENEGTYIYNYRHACIKHSSPSTKFIILHFIRDRESKDAVQ